MYPCVYKNVEGLYYYTHGRKDDDFCPCCFWDDDDDDDDANDKTRVQSGFNVTEL
jgi:hypothetical protein